MEDFGSVKIREGHIGVVYRLDGRNYGLSFVLGETTEVEILDVVRQSLEAHRKWQAEVEERETKEQTTREG